jgi:hypothetical protein
MNREMSVFKIILLPVLIIAGVCAGGVAVCLALRLNTHFNQMIWAAGVCLIAAEIAMVPVFIVRGKPADNAVQGALISTVIHMALAAGGGLVVMQLNHPPQAFIYWLCAFYWTSLAGVCRVLMQVVKSAPVPVLPPPQLQRSA